MIVLIPTNLKINDTQYLIDEYKNRMAIIGEIPVPVIDDIPNTYIYVLTSADLKVQKFKIGIHTGPLEKLKSRYRTYFEDITVLRFIATPDQNTHEKNLHQIFQDYKTHGEWFNLDQQTLLNKFDEYIQNNISIMDQYVPRYSITSAEKMLSRTLLEILQDIDSPKHNTGHTRGKLHKALLQVPEEAIVSHEIMSVLHI